MTNEHLLQIFALRRFGMPDTVIAHRLGIEESWVLGTADAGRFAVRMPPDDAWREPVDLAFPAEAM